MELLKLQDAAKMLNVSYPTLKQWIYHEKIRSIKTPGGHHRIPLSEIERLTGAAPDSAKTDQKKTSTKEVKLIDNSHPSALDLISGRNKLMGIVTDVKYDGLLAQVTMDVSGQTIVAIITRGSCEQLGMKKGMRAFALIKATEVMVIKG